MSMPYVLQRSDVPFPHKLWKACAVTWNDVTIIWGGMKGGPGGPLGNTMVYCFISGEWIMKETSGDVPQRCSSSVFPNRCDGSDVCIESSLGQWRAHPQVIKDQMFVLASPCGNDAALYSLDLRSWVWTRLSPSGTPPNRNIWWASSFSHSGKLYFFGGNISIELPENENGYDGHYKSSSTAIRAPSRHAGKSHVVYLVNNLFCYDIDKNSWQWPAQHGDVPSPRISSLTINNDGKVFLFGGVGHSPVDPYFPGSEGRIDFYRNKFQIRYNDLYTLDMSNLHWERVHGGIAKVHGDARDKVPKPTEAHRFSSHKSFIRLSRSTAVLYGTGRAVQYSQPANLHDDCFLLDLERAKSGVKPTSMWTRVRSHMAWRYHAAVLEPVSGSLWAIGGLVRQTHPTLFTSEVVKMRVSLLPLRMLAMDRCRRIIDSDDPRLRGSGLPLQLKNELEAYRGEIREGYWLCREAGCARCQQNVE